MKSRSSKFSYEEITNRKPCIIYIYIKIILKYTCFILYNEINFISSFSMEYYFSSNYCLQRELIKTSKCLIYFTPQEDQRDSPCVEYNFFFFSKSTVVKFVIVNLVNNVSRKPIFLTFTFKTFYNISLVNYIKETSRSLKKLLK